MNSSIAACEISNELPTLPILVVELTITVMLAPSGFILNACLIYSIIKSSLFNNNLRILLGHMSLMASLYCLATFVKYISVFVFMLWDPCYLVSTLYNCKLKEIAIILPLLGMIYSLVAIGFERLFATLFYKTYDHVRNIYLSIIMIICIWCMNLTIYLYPLPNIPLAYIPLCQSLLALNKQAATSTLAASGVMEILSVLSFICTTFLDRFKLSKLMINRAHHTLTARFQLSQNVKVNKIMLPSALAHFVCFIPSHLFATSAIFGWEMNLFEKIEFIHLSLLLIVLFTNLHGIIIFYNNDRLREHISNRFPGIKKYFTKNQIEPISQAHDLDGTERHFQFLESIWNKGVLYK